MNFKKSSVQILKNCIKTEYKNYSVDYLYAVKALIKSLIFEIKHILT